MEKNIIGLDTIKLYYPDNLLPHWADVVGINYTYEEGNEFYFLFRGETLVFKFWKMRTTLSFSIPKIYYGGDNTLLAGPTETSFVFEELSQFLKTDLNNFFITRLDIASNITIDFNPKEIVKVLKPPKHFKGQTSELDGEYLHLNEAREKSRKILLLYSKGKEMRFEFRFISKSNSGQGIGKTIKQALKHDNTIAALLKPTFCENYINYYLDIIETTFRKKGKTELDKMIISAIHAGLSENYARSLTQY